MYVKQKPFEKIMEIFVFELLDYFPIWKRDFTSEMSIEKDLDFH